MPSGFLSEEDFEIAIDAVDAWPPFVDTDDEGTQAIRVHVDCRTLQLWFDEEDRP